MAKKEEYIWDEERQELVSILPLQAFSQEKESMERQRQRENRKENKGPKYCNGGRAKARFRRMWR